MKKTILSAVLSVCLFSILSGAEKLVFSCNFTDSYKPQVSVQPCPPDPNHVQIVDTDGQKVLRVGKILSKRAGRLVYPLAKQVKPQTLANAFHPFPLKSGRLQFRFRPVGWKLKDPGYNMLLRMEGPRGSLLHVIYICPRGVPSIQVAYGQQKNPRRSKGEIPVIYPFTKLDTTRKWHDVSVSWNPSEVTLQIDGNKISMSTRTLAYPETDFYAERLCVGYGLANLSLGETDIADLKIWAAEPEKSADKKKIRFPEITVNPMTSPVIDGKVTAAEWRKISTYSGFSKLPKVNISEYQPSVKIGYDRQNLYFAIQSKGHQRPPVSGETGRDGRVWKDDSIELYLSAGTAKEDYYHIILNHAGAIFDQHFQKGKSQTICSAWNCRGIRSKTEVSGDTRSTEIAVPFASIGMKTPKKGDTILFNLCENLIGKGYYSLASVKNRFADFDRFGVLKFADTASPVINFTNFGPLFRGEAAFLCSVSGKSAIQMEISAKRYDQTADTEFALFSEVVRVPEKPQVCFRAASDRLKKNGILYVQLREKGKSIYAGRFFYESTMAAEIENIRREIIKGKNHLRVVTSHMNDGKSRLQLAVLTQDKKQKIQKTVQISDLKQTTYLDIDKLSPGNYLLAGKLIDTQGQTLQQLEAREFSVYGKNPPWQDFVKKNIKTDHVPAPWTPLQLQQINGKIQVSCWNRVYTFGRESLFAEQITTAGIPLLKSPVKLLLNRNKSADRITGVTQKIISATARRVTIESCGKLSAGGEIKVTAEIDYDGFIWYQTNINIPAGNILNRLSLQIDMKKENSSLLNCGFRDLQNTGYTPSYWSKSLEGISGPFWVGMEKGGLSFGIESTENWSNKKVTSQAEVFRKKDKTSIFLNMVDTSLKTGKTPVYGFYIHPTPVRPRPDNYRKLRAQDWFAFKRTCSDSRIAYPANFSWWTTTWYYQGDPDWAVDAKGIEKVCKRIEKHYLKHKKSFNFDGMDKKRIRSAWYAAYSSVGRNAPEVIWNGDFWYAGPRERLYGNTLYGYEMDMIEVCKTQDYCDFFLWKFDRTRKNKPVVDGLYFDLWGAAACDRKEHGHGYIDRSGVRKAVHPVREHRKFLELIYLYCKEHANNAPIVCHVSGATAHIAGYSYADYLLDGELWFDKLAEDRSYKSMSLDMARSEILPHIWGPGILWLSELHRAKGYVPAGEQKNWALSPWAQRHFSGLLLLHDVLPDRTSLFETARKVWIALDKFGLADQDIYLPYWEKCGISGSNDGKNTAITGYLKKAENKMLLVVFNNHDRQINAKVKLDMKKLFGINGSADISDLESGKMLFSGKTEFSVPVSMRNFRLLQVKLK